MAAGDGDGWAHCARGHRHWGVHGASGLLAVHHDAGGTPHILMQKRSFWSHHGGTWGLPGGARDSHEDAISSALREAREEAALYGDGLRVQGVYLDDHGGWSFETVIAEADGLLPAAPANSESADLRWLPLDQVAARRLHPGFAETWPAVSRALRPLVIVLDAANIVGARAEHGWWRDRAGATARLATEVSALVGSGLRAVPERFPALARWFPRIVMVVEGAARGVAPLPGVTVMAAPGSGDDTIVRAVQDAPSWEDVLVVTADRALRERVTERGAEVTGPRWLLAQLSAAGS
ncbi:NUDIX hydrolase [Planomonospora venezuelensis]|uniref:8-oxo-dGTP pyrophosphatase MutT (NUDIX family) n=1 Tax=Planomonospora venezuelensis TaxID=1999 RepID=A0A841D010_PLAVE|nr:NUDIX hydrolase [Planomonospora venezuelensis]MBB5960896.1 8-oxo-dGTP pyrophosphatase MutT (NUDIX family) [Planomonospora venezuelensis]GIN01131.1 NTP pyrophosphohydrolase [Planomonospora venezuelensis]